MTCRECLEKFAALSADDVSGARADTILQHLKDCPPCQGEWVLFERTLLVLSTSTQALPSSQASSQMWERCSEHIFVRVEKDRARRRGVLGWFWSQPRWSWASLIAAFAILGAAWFFAPHDEAIQALAGTHVTQAGLGPGALMMFQRPPAGTSDLINHHSGMAADPFADNVGATMASYSATSPAPPSTPARVVAPVPALTPVPTTAAPAVAPPAVAPPAPSTPLVSNPAPVFQTPTAPAPAPSAPVTVPQSLPGH